MDSRLRELLKRLATTRGQGQYAPVTGSQEDLREFQSEIDDIEQLAAQGLLNIIGIPHRESRTGKRYRDRIKVELTAKGVAWLTKGDKDAKRSDISSSSVESSEAALAPIETQPMQSLERLKRDFDEKVVSAFRSESRVRGTEAFDVWKKEFISFLEQYFPHEVNRFEQLTSDRNDAQPSQKQNAYNSFMQGDGNTSLTFLEIVGDQVESGMKLDQVTMNIPQVFISYAREDSVAAQRLYQDLAKAGLRIWFDTESLLPGQNWKSTIRKAIQESRYVMALLSHNSVSKKGYVQRELKDALDVLAEYPASSVFMIPARLDECSPSDERIRDLHWVDLFENWENGIKRILKTIAESER